MRALSILQPWAWLIANGHKDIENRTWRTSFRGQILIHAGRKWGPEQREDLESVRAEFQDIQMPAIFDRGGVVGLADIVGCVDAHESPWFNGPHGFLIANACPLRFVDWRGQLGFFDIPRASVLPGTTRAEDCEG